MTDGPRAKSTAGQPVDSYPRLHLPRDGTAISPVLGASLRRYAAVPGGVVDKFRKWEHRCRLVSEAQADRKRRADSLSSACARPEEFGGLPHRGFEGEP
jgi:hypothetical protein